MTTTAKAKMLPLVARKLTTGPERLGLAGGAAISQGRFLAALLPSWSFVFCRW
jgi:hypothetical protein